MISCDYIKGTAVDVISRKSRYLKVLLDVISRKSPY